MNSVLPPPLTLASSSSFRPLKYHPRNTTSPCRFRALGSRNDQSESIGITESDNSRPKYRPGIFDDLFLNLFRNRMVNEVGWDSEKPGYDGLIEVANRLMMRRSNSETKEAAVRILRALFPPLLLELYQMLIAPLQGGKVAAIMVARVTALSCQWLMGPCAVNNVDLPDGSSLRSGVFVERCKYLEESQCVGICINTCKLPTQFKFGVLPPRPEDDNALNEPCLEICPNARQRREFTNSVDVLQCPKA
ncbi:beta-carotene isomerase D27, chloroplastic isoform X5 [Rhododendron vialii]|uniref:beta-carotene isomerase D27, chloroplastic isoform X5 n=1 Tax=Rhododendron vialii TaxID=182163 RepID=UPI00265E5A53|nr:beta-carotene isomerase D27, chloroplastic isoform X5 [Rhododendron vialii]